MLCVPATLLAGNTLGLLPVTPLLLQMAVVIAAEQLTTAYKRTRAGRQRSAFLGAALYLRLRHRRRHLGPGRPVLVRAGIPFPPRPIWRWPFWA